MIEIAVWILAIVGVVRIIQNSIQLKALKQDQKAKNGLYNEFIESLNKSNQEWVHEVLESYKDMLGDDNHERF